MNRLLIFLIIVFCQVAYTQDNCEQDSENTVTVFPNKILKALNPEACQGLPLKSGQVKKFSRPYTWTGLSSSHAMKKIDDNHYQAILNLNFIENGVAGTENTARMKDQVLRCIQIANTKIRGPEEEVLEIKIIDPVSARQLPQAEVPERLDINVLPPNRPSNMLNFSTMDCANITHEIFHMMGLVDEYDDSLRSKNGVQETCRIIPTRNTLMGLPSKYFEDVFGKTVECNCASTCQKFWSSNSAERRKFIENQNDPCSLLQALKTRSFVEETSADAVSTLEGEKLTIVRRPKTGVQSLLTTNQFKKLLSGYCEVGVEGYAKCSSYSYFQRLISPGQANPQCADVPAECGDDEFYLGTP